MNTEVLIKALKAFKLSIKDVQSITAISSLSHKVYLNRGRGCLFLEGHEVEVRRKRQKDGNLSFFRIELPEPAYRVRYNQSSWVNLPA